MNFVLVFKTYMYFFLSFPLHLFPSPFSSPLPSLPLFPLSLLPHPALLLLSPPCPFPIYPPLSSSPLPSAYITRCEVHSVYKRATDRRYVYMIQVEWSDGTLYTVRRTYGDFFSFQTKVGDSVLVLIFTSINVLWSH